MKTYLMVFTLLLPAAAAAQLPPVAAITVYTTAALMVDIPAAWRPITAVVVLDSLRALENRIGQGITPAADAAAVTALSERLTPDVVNQLRDLWTAMAWLQQHNVTHLPAVVIDQQTVYYGFNLRRAVALHQQAVGD